MKPKTSQTLSLKTYLLERLLAEGRRLSHLPAVSASTALESVFGELDRLRAEREQTPRKAATK